MKLSLALMFPALVASTAALVVPSSTVPKPFSAPDAHILSLSGPGCPPLTAPRDSFPTRISYGLDINGNKEFYKHVTYPWLAVGLAADLGEPSSRYCDVTLNISAPAEFQIVLGRNGTRALATYDLDEGVEVGWKFEYDVPGADKRVDSIKVIGPLHTGNDEVAFNASVPAAPYTFPTCGEVVLKLRAEVTVKGTKEGEKGRVDSQRAMYEHDGYKGSYAYGVSQGISLHAVKCGV